MLSDSGATVSCWMSRVQMPVTGPLEEDKSADVCIVGAGMAGISIAYSLVREGAKVVVIDDGEIGSGETGRTTAHLASALDDRFSRLIRLFGERGAHLAYQSHARAIDRIEQNAEQEGLDCDFTRVDGYLYQPPEGTVNDVLREFEAARRAGVGGVQIVGCAPLPFDTGPALRFPRQGQFHPLKYLAGLSRAILARGGRIYTSTRAVDIAGGRDARVMTASDRRISASQLVIATNTPINDMLVMHSKQAAYRTYAIAFALNDDSLPQALYWDDADPYHYIRVQPPVAPGGSKLLIVGGADHKTGQAPGAEAAIFHLEEWTRKCFSMAGEALYRWSGQVMEPVDGLGYIGRNPADAENVYIVTGDSGHGMTHATIASMLIPDLIAGRDNPWAEIYDPSRKTKRALGRYAHENANVAAQYRDWLTASEVGSVEEIAPGSGAILRDGMRKIAVWRDTTGQLHTFSAVCPHMQCIVRWNGLEKTFDCPCHGSRFRGDGEPVNGPAISGLPAEQTPAPADQVTATKD